MPKPDYVPSMPRTSDGIMNKIPSLHKSALLQEAMTVITQSRKSVIQHADRLFQYFSYANGSRYDPLRVILCY